MHTVYIKNKNWLQFQAPQAASWAVKCICKAKQACCDTLDSSSWLTKNKFSIKEVYNLLKNQTGKTQWARYVWNRLPIPKHRFTLWVLLLERLKTRDRLFQYGVCVDNLCPLCGISVETCAHLFFDCVYSRKLLADLMAWLGLSTHITSVILILQWIRRNCKSVFKRKVFYAAMAGGVYQIWKARNSAVWDLSVPTIVSLLHSLQFDIKHRILSLSSKKLSDADREWLVAL
ncbi:uncharacterized protein [Spinacia oleracea]|uniref:Reverse transcriptase zinc-binding domain-containing protein n=1 Tax=Spinacia oleracea TaxID=3562 RepID=A0A9R0IYG2_SPIOL|nr:uncharacterized protein LOC110795860 [Spinacia oleracea]